MGCTPFKMSVRARYCAGRFEISRCLDFELVHIPIPLLVPAASPKGAFSLCAPVQQQNSFRLSSLVADLGLYLP